MKSTLSASSIKKVSCCLFFSVVAGFSYSQSAMAFNVDEAFKTMMCRMVAIETGQCREKVNPTIVTPQPNPTIDPDPNSPVPDSPIPDSDSDEEETDEDNSSEFSQIVDSSNFQYLDVSPNRN